MRGPGWLELSRSLCLGLGAAVPAEAECSRVLRGEQGLRAEGPGSFLHSILWMKKGQTEGGDQGKCQSEEPSDNTSFCLPSSANQCGIWYETVNTQWGLDQNLSCWFTSLILALKKQRQENYLKFKANLVYIKSSRLTTLSQKQTNKWAEKIT